MFSLTLLVGPFVYVMESDVKTMMADLLDYIECWSNDTPTWERPWRSSQHAHLTNQEFLVWSSTYAVFFLDECHVSTLHDLVVCGTFVVP